MTTIPYTHWMYLAGREAAGQCAAELSGPDFLCGVDFSPPPAGEEKARLAAEHPALADFPESPPHGRWLLRAARETADTIAQHQMVEEITTRDDGCYDGGETGLMDPRTGQFIRQAES